MALTGSLAADAAAGSASKPLGGEPPRQQTVLPRLDSTNVITGFTALAVGTAAVGDLLPITSTTYTASARRGHVFVNDGIAWRDLTSVFPTGYYYDITVAPAPSAGIPAGGIGAITLGNTGTPAGQLRVTVRRADGAIFATTCNVSTIPAGFPGTPATVIPLSATNCTQPATL
ncbi:hypothetical protein GCM10010116_30570 [Microbispora rosea subsp. aerata]|nr:hypothetical protein [Microbispora rosea]GGO15235.1 hypothetical protein GCM10010116_30570 [Microbispora rosea subsp. aerata]GIH57539.1 hypothetical protein Mro02_44530 [Microbispora rosea subsp. aerata]GLJ85509.1 hypothetical protein GCM10017588_42420 [Microbispora rosea subsp. aerata]